MTSIWGGGTLTEIFLRFCGGFVISWAARPLAEILSILS